MQNTSKPAATLWYRQFWPWFLILLPGAAVAVTLAMLVIAVNHADDSVHETVSKKGLAISREQTAVAAARRLQLQGRAEIDAGSGAVGVQLRGQLARAPAALTLVFIHPFAGSGDFSVALQRSGDGAYRGQLAHALRGRWTLELFDAANPEWRLHGRADLRQARTFALQP